MCLPLTSLAQDMLSFFDGQSFATRMELENLSSFAPDAVSTRAFSIQRSLYKEGKNFLTVGARWQKLDFERNANELRDYQNIQGNFNFRRELEEKKFWSISTSYGSASDRPFQNGRDGAVGATYIKKQSQRWMWLVNYSNNRAFLNNIPLPGFVYFHSMSKERAFVAGFPFIYWVTPLSERLSLRYFGLLPWSHRLRIAWVGLESVEPYVSLEQGPSTYFDSRREDRYDRTFWFERKAAVGAEGKFLGPFKYDIQVGHAFDRVLYEARNFSDKRNSELTFASTAFVSLSFKVSF